MKPVRIPNKLTSKKLLVRIFALYLVGFVLFMILTVQVRVFGKVLRQLPVADMKLLCVVGDDQAQYLCLSGWSLEELAQRREKSLQRGFLTRQDLPLLKRNPDWQECFAKEYLLRSGNFFRKIPVLWIPFDPVVAIFLRRLYPQLPFLDLRNPMLGRVGAQPRIEPRLRKSGIGSMKKVSTSGEN